MARRLLLIEQESVATGSNLALLLSATAGVRCDRVTWDAFVPDNLSRSAADLIVASAVPPTAGAMNLFEWLRGHVIAAPRCCGPPRSLRLGVDIARLRGSPTVEKKARLC